MPRLRHPESSGFPDLDRMLADRGLTPADVTVVSHPEGPAVETNFGEVPIWERWTSGDDPMRLLSRCLDATAASVTWLIMVEACGEDPRRPPAWAQTMSTPIIRAARRGGWSLKTLHKKLWAHWVTNLPYGDLLPSERGRFFRHFDPVRLRRDHATTIIGEPRGSRMNICIDDLRWSIRETDHMQLIIRKVGEIASTALQARVGGRLSALVSPGSVPILDAIDPLVAGAQMENGEVVIGFDADAAPMVRPPREALMAVGLRHRLPRARCAWWEAAPALARFRPFQD